MIAVDVEEFAARFVGPDVDDHTMDVTVLGPALLAFGEMHRAALRVAAPFDERVPRVRVKEVAAGSFEVVLAVDLTLLEHVRTLLSKENVSYVADIGGILALVIAGINAVCQKARGRRYTFDELSTMFGDAVVARIVDQLGDDRQFIEGAQKMTRPMLDADIDRLEIRRPGGAPEVSLDKEDAELIDRLAVGEEVRVKVIEQVVTVVTAQFADPMRRKWRFESEELGVFTAKMLDRDFVALVERRELRLGGVAGSGCGCALRRRCRCRMTVR